MQKLEKWLTPGLIGILAVAYGYWAFTVETITAASMLAAAAATILFGILLAYCVRGLCSMWDAPEVDLAGALGRRSIRHSYRHPAARLFFALLASRVIVYIVAYAVLTLQKGYSGGILDTFSLWLKGDAPHYLGIAENWYVTQGDPRFHIVFFPLYPIVVRLAAVLTGSTLAAGLVVSALCTIIAGILLYELAILDMDRTSALRTAALQMLLPAAFLFNAPMSDALFLMLSVAVMLLTRKKQYWTACLVGALAAFTRVLGLVLLVPVGIELIGDVIRTYKSTGKWIGFFFARGFALLLIPAGFLMYLIINKSVTGDAFAFLHYQNEHWNQRMGWFFNTASYQTNGFLSAVPAQKEMAYGLWLPNLLYLFGAPVVMILALRKTPQRTLPAEEETEAAVPPYALRPSYVAYFAAYYCISMGATWLLSAPRYLTACFPLAIALSKLTKTRSAWGIYALLCLVQLLYLCAYVADWLVY